jgi:signal transduction histidine kinase
LFLLAMTTSLPVAFNGKDGAMRKRVEKAMESGDSSSCPECRPGVRTLLEGTWSGAYHYNANPIMIDSLPETSVPRGVGSGTVAPVARPGLLTPEFISEMAHELRAPLTSIKGYVDYLLEGVAGEIGPVQRDFLERAQANTTRLMSLLGDLLDLIRIDAGLLVPNPASVPLDTVLPAVMSELRSTASQRAIELTAHGATNAVVWADREMLQRLLLTLMRRAVSRSPDERRVSAELDFDDNGSVVVAVRDSGTAAMPLDDMCFATFEFLPATSSRDERTGLELAIAKALVEVQGGRIWAKGEPGTGCTIYFSLPAPELKATR